MSWPAVTRSFAVFRSAPDQLIALMARKDGATIQDFQGVDGFNIPSMAVVRIAERHGYKASANARL